MQVVCVCATF